jgi:hypothetical protein
MSNPHMVPQTTNAKGAARMLGMSVGSFYNRKTKLAAAGFPERLPGTNVWSVPAIHRWIDSNGETAAPDQTNEVDAARNRLQDKYAGAAS